LGSGWVKKKKVLAFNYKFTRSDTEKEQLMLKRINTSPAKPHTNKLAGHTFQTWPSVGAQIFGLVASGKKSC